MIYLLVIVCVIDYRGVVLNCEKEVAPYTFHTREECRRVAPGYARKMATKKKIRGAYKVVWQANCFRRTY